MKERLVNISKSAISYLTRVDLLAAAVIAVVILAVTINTSIVIMQNYNLQRQVDIAQQKVDIAQAELDNQRLKNTYYTSDSYLDIAARKQLNQGLPGEKLVIVPHDVAMSYVKDINLETQTVDQADTQDEALSNFQKWLRFINGRLQ
ncbi:hypothetical protein KC930_03385 [Candidatus Saccharibacteria bacterium]|nr:hypothetical protein [Candidatus Saccharibacteria bacterium]